MRNTIRKSRVERPLRKLRHLKPTIDKGEREKKRGGGIYTGSEKMHSRKALRKCILILA